MDNKQYKSLLESINNIPDHGNNFIGNRPPSHDWSHRTPDQDPKKPWSYPIPRDPRDIKKNDSHYNLLRSALPPHLHGILDILVKPSYKIYARESIDQLDEKMWDTKWWNANHLEHPFHIKFVFDHKGNKAVSVRTDPRKPRLVIPTEKNLPITHAMPSDTRELSSDQFSAIAAELVTHLRYPTRGVESESRIRTTNQGSGIIAGLPPFWHKG